MGRPSTIVLKTREQIEKMRVANQIVGRVLKRMREYAEPGMSTQQLDDEAVRMLEDAGAKPAFLGYQGYPRSVCTSINSEVVHGIPSADRVLRDGDLLSIDFGVVIDGFYGDSAITIPIGEVSPEALRLIRTTREALWKGIEQALVGNRLFDISHAVQSHVEAAGFSVVRDFVGHGIGQAMHEPPQIPNFGDPGRGVRLRPGMVLAVEPMVNIGSWEIEVLGDGWTAVTRDGSLSAHFEHTFAITDQGPDVLSLVD
ncbi:MAG: type I methionyl aminopeptidase [Candidatus Alcyoniella australis]|nr:type I methionyl aminopeptidase [Candidatus Alcyoniella australis]